MTGFTRSAGSTAWNRDQLVALSDDLLEGLRPYANDQQSLIVPPGAHGGYGRWVDGLEGFARSFLLASFRIAGGRGEDLTGLIERYTAGMAAGVDPTNEQRWPTFTERAQAKVEGAIIALGLDMTRPWLWDQLSSRTQEHIVDYLSPAVGDDTYPQINWVWFRLMAQTFLRSVGGPFDIAEMEADLAAHDSFWGSAGWRADGHERAFDHYTGWVLNTFPTLWARMQGADDLSAARGDRDRASLDRYLRDAVWLVGSDGGPLAQGRTLTYRFAAAAPFWAGAIAEVPSVPLSQLRAAGTSVVQHFVDHGVPDAAGLLTVGWHDHWLQMAQRYTGPGSPYWAALGLMGIALPSDHPIWAAEPELPIRHGSAQFVIEAPGWLVSATRSDGIARVVNHGTDHSVPQARVGDSPLYARLAYSTGTWPLSDELSWQQPSDNSIVLVSAQGERSHRAGFEQLGACELDKNVLVAASRCRAHWLACNAQQKNHGSGYEGDAQVAGDLTMVSAVHGPWEIRFAKAENLATDAQPVGIAMTGWPLTDVTECRGGNVTNAAGLLSSLLPLVGEASTGELRRQDASPLGDHHVVIPQATFTLLQNAWVASLVLLTRPGAFPDEKAVAVAFSAQADLAEITWPDGLISRVPLPASSTRPWPRTGHQNEEK